MKNISDRMVQREKGPENTLKIIKDLIKIKSYLEGEMEKNVIDYIGNRIKKHQINYDTLTYNKNKIGIVASIGKGKHSLIFHAHLDTVPPADRKSWTHDPFDPYCSKDRIYGLGACDDKGSLAAMLAVFEDLIPIAPTLNGKLTLIAVGGEERGGVGTQTAVKQGYKAESVILGEPTNMEPKFAHKGVLRLEITSKGSAAHASSPGKGINAIIYMSKLIPKLNELAMVVNKEHEPYTGNASMAITTIKGGTALNMIPDTCSISIDRRIIPGQKEVLAMKQIEKVIKEFKLTNPEADISVKKIRFTSPAITDPGEPISKLALKVASEELQREISPSGFTACCDMAFLRNEGGMPVVIMGPGDIAMAHKKNEYVEKESLYKAYRIYKRIATKWLFR